jgi:hypothetical protein
MSQMPGQVDARYRGQATEKPTPSNCATLRLRQKLRPGDSLPLDETESRSGLRTEVSSLSENV